MSKKRNRIRTAKRAEEQLNSTVRSFMLSVQPGTSAAEAQQKFNQHNENWKTYCTKMEKRHKWLQMDANAFQERVELINRSAERKLQPVKYYGKRVVPALVLAIIIWAVTDLALPYFGVTQYQLFQ